MMFSRFSGKIPRVFDNAFPSLGRRLFSEGDGIPPRRFQMVQQKSHYRTLLELTVLGVIAYNWREMRETIRGSELYATVCSSMMPLLRKLDPENAHALAIWFAKWGFMPVSSDRYSHPELRNIVAGIEFANPVGLAAGVDKNADAPVAFLRSGFGFVEVGTITPRPQEGNPRPRLFRLEEDEAIINRYGFNNDGSAAVRDRIVDAYNVIASTFLRGNTAVMGVNIGVNKDSANPVADYQRSFAEFCFFGRYITVNISSPNTPGLRNLQSRENFARIADTLNAARQRIFINSPESVRPRIFYKFSPDMSDEELRDVAEVAMERSVDALILTNTSIQRESLPWKFHESSKEKLKESGGLSGRPIHELSKKTVSRMYELTKGRVPIVGVGGISNAREALDMIKAGASLVQVYTALIYKGPTLAGDINRDLAALLKAEGFTHISQAIGADHLKEKKK